MAVRTTLIIHISKGLHASYQKKEIHNLHPQPKKDDKKKIHDMQIGAEQVRMTEDFVS